MEAVLFVFFLLAFVMVAPPYVVAVTATGLLVASLIAQWAAKVLSGTKVSLAAAFRTLVITSLLSMLAVFATMSVVVDTPPAFQQALTSGAAQLFTCAAYVLGFRIGLGLAWRHAAVVAAASSVIIGLCIWLAETLPATGHWLR